MDWRRFDTLGLRLFVLMWVTLVLSNLLAYAVALPMILQSAGHNTGSAMLDRLKPQNLPTLPSLPPGGPFGTGPANGGPGGSPPGRLSGAPQASPQNGLQGAPQAASPDGPRAGPGGPGGGGQRPGLPAAVLWLDYGVRGLIIALGAALGARWLAGPMRRLAGASVELSQGLARGRPPPVLDDARGSAEVRQMARVFNGMATRLQEQFDARGMHLASVSHDLRTPLTRLRMRLEDAPPALADAAGGDIHEMSEMIDATLDVLREQRDGGQASRVDVRALLEAIVDDMAASGHSVALDAAGRPHALARPAALRRIVSNLVANALRYGGSASLVLQARTDGVAVLVDDDGPGIPPDQLELAFKPWVRLDTAHARSGHGLGLAIARDLAERDGGCLSLTNRGPDGKGGLRATLLLPQAQATVSAPTRSG